MNNAIPYLVQKGDTLQSIANDLGIINGADLRHYHNMTSEPKDGIGPSVTPGKTLLTPPQEKIDEINAKRAAYDNARAAEKAKEEEQKNAVKQEEEKQQKKEEEKQKQAEESEHEGKYFVVHKALCVCNQAENPKQTAKLQVTSHKKVIFNGQEGQFTATDADKTFDPPVATFGKCKLQPSSSGYQPCTLSPAPKWNKPYNKSIIYGNKALTELSTLPCTIGGKVEVAKNGQTDSVMKEHAENTNPAALALLNPAVKMPVLKPAFPSVSSITLKAIQSDDNFSPVRSSKEKEVKRVMVRQNKECAFTAKIDKGNVNLTSWVIYEGFTGEKDKRLYTSEQIGSTFKNSFPALGKYRVEGYGKPKIEEGENAKNYKHYPDCSIDVEVTENKLNGTELEAIDGENFAKKISGKMRLRQNFPATFKAHFLMPPTEEELENLRMYVTDASGNVLKSVKVKNTVSFTPENSKAVYKITAIYKNSSGETQTQYFTGETISNTVSAITHNATVIRRGTPMTFAIAKGTFSFFVPEEQTAIDREVSTVKWNLNGRLMGRGRSITLPGHEFTNLGKYVVEAYCTLANAYGANAKDEEDDWHFEVKDNDVESFSYIGNPKVGKTTQLEADRCVFPQTIGAEMIIWDTSIPHKVVDKKTISITPIRAGKQLVQCRINRQKGVTLSIDVKQAKILGMLFTDSSGIEIEKSKWFQTVNIWVKQEHLIGEDLTIEIWDKDKMSADDYCKVINVKEYDGNLIPLTLDSYIKSKAGDWGSLYVKIGAPKLKLANPNNIFESTNRLDVQNKREIYSAQIGTQDGKERHYHVDYNQISYFYGKSRGIKAGEKLKITIYEKGKVLFEVPAKDISVDESGKILAKVKWDSIAVKLSMRTVYAVVQDAENIILYNGAKAANGGVAVTKKSALLGLAEYKSAVLVGKAKDMAGNKSGTCVCKDYDLVWGNKFTCDERKKVVEICVKLWGESKKREMANHLMNCMALETAESFTASKGYPKATGLVQFTDSALQGMNEKNKYNNGTILTKERLSKMTILEQLNYVELYFKMWIDRGKIIKDSLDMYMCIWCPAAVGQDNSFICYSEQKDKDAREKNPKAIQPYDSNKSIDGEYYQEKGNIVLKGSADKEIRKEELRPRLKVKTVLGNLNRAIVYDCKTVMNEVDCLDTWDKVTNVKIKELHPKIQCAVKNFINDVEKSMGIKLRVIQGYRTYEEQDNLYAQGRTKVGSIITKAKGGESNHNFGLAIDVAEIKNGTIDWKEQEIVLPKIAPIGKKWGFEWGGDWKSFKDKPHFEMVFGKTTENLRILNEEVNKDYTKIKL